MTNRPLIALVLVLAAAATQAEARSPIGGATMSRDPLQADPLGPRSEPTVTERTSVVTIKSIEKSGYSAVRGLSRGTDGTWHAVARNAGNTPVAVALDDQGKVVETR